MENNNTPEHTNIIPALSDIEDSLYRSDVISCSYSSEYNCDGGCNSGDYCRCGTIENAKITSFDYALIEKHIISHIIQLAIYPNIELTMTDDELYKQYIKHPDNKIFIYGIKKILSINSAYDQSNYEVKTTSGYYGEEIDGYSFSNNKKMIADLNTYLHLKSDQGRMEFLLRREYNIILKDTKDLEWEFKTITHKNIQYQKKHMDEVEQEGVHYNIPVDTPIVVIEKSPKFLRLVDGYHRYFKLHDNKTINIIVGKLKN